MDTPLTDRIRADLAAHPGDTAGRIASRLSANQHIIIQILNEERQGGRCRRERARGKGPWRWTLTEDRQ